MIDLRRRQRSFGDGLIAEQVDELWEDWMRAADTVLEDEVLLTTVWEALARRRPHSKTRGRPGTPADVVLRMLLLKHIRNWSFAVLVREVRANLVYRQFTRVGAEKVPDDKTLGRLARALGPEIIDKIHQRLVALAQHKKVIHGRKMRVDTTVVETNIHYPTDSSLLGDGVGVLTRLRKKVTAIAGFYSARGERAVTAMGVERVAVPHRSTKSERRQQEQKKRWFKNGQKWRTGSEGRISLLKRRHGLNRSRYQGDAGLRRWVGLGVIADNLINIGRVLAGST